MTEGGPAEGSREVPEPAAAPRGDEPSTAVVAADEHAPPERREKRVLATEDLPDWMVNLIAAAEVDPRFARTDKADRGPLPEPASGAAVG